MPRSTFFNIPEEKQQRIYIAAQNEFISVPFEEASINKIIKEADIPRGSFYQYFEDKQDLFDYCFSKERDKILLRLIMTLNKYNGDIFDCVNSYIDDIFDSIVNKDMRIINMFMNNVLELEGNLLEILKMKVDNSDKAIYDYMVMDNLNVEEEEIETMLIMIISIVVENIKRIQYKHQKGTLEEEQHKLKEEFIKQITLMKKAFTK